MPSYEQRIIDIYGAELYLCRNRRQWAALKRRITDLPDIIGHGQTTFVGGGDRPIIAFYMDVANMTDDFDLVNTASHEAAHAALMLFEYINQETQDSHEPFAYLTGWLTQWIWEHCRLQMPKK